MTFNVTKKTLATGVATAALGLSLAAPAQADMFAYAKLLLNDFTIFGSDGEILDATTDFNSLSFTSTADMSGDLTGTAGFNFTDSTASGEIDFPSSCLSTTGDCPQLAENAFPFLSGAQGNDFVSADQIQIGSPIDGIGLSTPATIGAIAAANLSTTNATGSAQANNGLEASWTFSLNQDQGISFSGSVELFLQAFASAGEDAPGSASAATTFGVTITELATGNVIFDASTLGAGILTQNTAVNPQGFPIDIQTCGTLNCAAGQLNFGFALPTVQLTANTLYQLSARNNVNIDITREAPVPGILALMGAGFLGLFAAGRRRRQA